ncbi:MAG: hypothetical protein WBK19_03125 [Azonexus sp.]
MSVLLTMKLSHKTISKASNNIVEVMKLRSALSLVSICLLGGCSQTHIVVKPDYPSALIWDSALSEDGGRAAFFVLTAVDGTPIEENSMKRSIRANIGRGRNLYPMPVERYVAAGKHRLTLTGQFGTAAPIEYLLRPSSFAKVSGEVDVELKPDTIYRVTGVLEPLRREVWLTEWNTSTQVGDKIIDSEIAEDAKKAMAGAQFTCCNLHYKGDWISDTNETTLPMIPAGTPIVLKGFGFNRASVLINAREMRIGHDYGRKQETKEKYLAKVMVNNDPKTKIKNYPQRIQDAIAAGKVCKGMTREQVIISLGYPRTDTTPDLSQTEWKYWTANWDEYLVVWGEDGLVQSISAPLEILGQVSTP